MCLRSEPRSNCRGWDTRGRIGALLLTRQLTRSDLRRSRFFLGRRTIAKRCNCELENFETFSARCYRIRWLLSDRQTTAVNLRTDDRLDLLTRGGYSTERRNLGSQLSLETGRGARGPSCRSGCQAARCISGGGRLLCRYRFSFLLSSKLKHRDRAHFRRVSGFPRSPTLVHCPRILRGRRPSASRDSVRQPIVLKIERFE